MNQLFTIIFIGISYIRAILYVTATMNQLFTIILIGISYIRNHFVRNSKFSYIQNSS